MNRRPCRLHSILFILLSFASIQALAQRGYVPNPNPVQFDFEYEESRVAKPGDSGAFTELAQLYLEANRPQEAIWTYRRGGRRDLAEPLADSLREFLRTTPINANEYANPVGVTKPRRYKLAPGIQAIFKPEGSHRYTSPKQEIIAYELAEMLQLDIVPMTVAREIGGVEGSLQYWVPDLKSGSRQLNITTSYGEGFESLYVLDVLLMNKDRRATNWGTRPGGQIVAFDHSLTVNAENGNYWHYDEPVTFSKLDVEIALPTRVGERLRGLSEHDIARQLARHGSPETIAQIIAMRNYFVEAIERRDPLASTCNLLQASRWRQLSTDRP